MADRAPERTLRFEKLEARQALTSLLPWAGDPPDDIELSTDQLLLIVQQHTDDHAVCLAQEQAGWPNPTAARCAAVDNFMEDRS